MRKLLLTVIAGAVGALVMASSAQAIPTFSVRQSGTGLATVTAASLSSTITFDVLLTFGAGDPLAGYAVSLTWDGGPSALLDGVTVTSTVPPVFAIPIAIVS